MYQKKILINLSVFNSFKNLNKIFYKINKSKIKIKKIIIVDNNSTIPLNKKLSIANDLSKKYRIKICLIINKQNYGFGGSQKILFAYLKNIDFDYLINLGTSDRYKVLAVMKDLKKSINKQYDYYLYSRFLNKESTRKYNRVRRDFNIIFILLTKILTGTYFSDPGQSTYILTKKLFKKLDKLNIKNITNGSHFPHFFNIKLYKSSINFQEIPIFWKDGNVKSHLNAFSYVPIFLFSLIKYFFTKEFIIKKNNTFKFKIFNFSNGKRN